MKEEKGKHTEEHKGGEQVYAAFFEGAKEAMFLSTEEGVVLNINRAFLDLFGYTRDEIIGRDLKLIHLNVSDSRRWMEEGSPEETAASLQVRLVRKDGSVLDSRVSLKGRKALDHRVEGLSGIIHDVTDMKKEHDAQQKKEILLGKRIQVLDCLNEVSDFIDRKGFSFEEIIQNVAELIPRGLSYSDIACVRISIDGKIYTTERFQQAPWRISSDIVSRLQIVGTIEVFYLEERPKSDEGPFTKEERMLLNGVASRLGRSYSRKRAEEMLRESEERYRSLFEDSRDAIYTTSKDGILLDANEATLEMFGYSRDEMIGMNIQTLYCNQDERMQFQKEIEEKGSVRSYEVLLKNKDGQIMNCLYTSSTRKSSEGIVIGYHSIVRDITSRKRAEEERQRLIHELQDALEKIKTLRGFIPICASCKKIRDDKGYWNHLEEYIEMHSDAVFSHGLCPECQRKFEEE